MRNPFKRRATAAADAETLQAAAAVHDYGDHLNGLFKSYGWNNQHIDQWWRALGSCGTKTCEQIVEESADCGGIVFTASHAWAEASRDAPATILHRVNGQWECVPPSFSADAATVYRCVDDMQSDCGEFEDLVYNASIGLASVGRANAFTYQLPTGEGELPDATTYYQVATPGSLTAVRERNNGPVVGYDWQRSRGSSNKIRVPAVKRILWSDSGFDHDPLMLWKPACKWIELYDKLCLLLSLQVDQNSLGGFLWFESAPADGGKPPVVDAMMDRLDAQKNGRPTTDPITGAGTKPEFIEFPNVQQVIFEALPIVAREIGRLGPIEMGSLADGEVSGSHWAAAMRDRHNLSRLVGPLRKRVDAAFTRWALRPKLEELQLSGQFVSNPADWKLGHDLDAIANRTDNVSDVLNSVRFGAVGLAAVRRTLRMKESDRPTPEDLEIIKCMIGGQSASETRDEFGDYDEDRARPDQQEVGAEVFGRDPGPDLTGSIPAPVQAAAAQDPYAGFELAESDPYSGVFAA